MKNIKYLSYFIGILVLTLVCNKNCKAQNYFHMSGYMLDHSYFNSASIASYDHISGSFFMKKQWTGLDGAPNFQGITLHTPIKKTANSIGVNMINDMIGINRNTSASILYSYRLKVNEKNYLSFGTSFSVNMLKSNYNLIHTIESSDPVYNGNTSFIAPNFSFGLYYFSNKYYIGISCPQLLTNTGQTHISNASTSFKAKNLHYFLHGGSEFTINKNFDLNASTLIKQIAGSPMQIDLNAQISYNDKISIGISGRTSKIIVGMLGFRINNYLKFSYAFDTNFSELNKVSSGSHELMLLFDFNKDMILPSIKSPRF